jgi:hypothetical protein
MSPCEIVQPFFSALCADLPLNDLVRGAGPFDGDWQSAVMASRDALTKRRMLRMKGFTMPPASAAILRLSSIVRGE